MKPARRAEAALTPAPLCRCLPPQAECAIGTANFDNRSFPLNFEITLEFASKEFTHQVVAMLQRDFADARPMTTAELEARSFWFRFATRAARLTAPIE